MLGAITTVSDDISGILLFTQQPFGLSTSDVKVGLAICFAALHAGTDGRPRFFPMIFTDGAGFQKTLTDEREGKKWREQLVHTLGFMFRHLTVSPKNSEKII